MALGRRTLRATVSGYAVLLRVPNLFTAPPDIALGAALASAAGGTASPVVTEAMVASMLFYAGGTALNDYFDADHDAVERPERPIPSGLVSRQSAFMTGIFALVGGIAVSAIAAWSAVVVAVPLALAILLYDGPLKGGPAGFLAMGLVRGLNVTLGLVAVSGLSEQPLWVFLGPVIVSGYIMAITYMAANEATDATRQAVTVGIAGVGVATLGVLIVHRLAGTEPLRFAVGLLLVLGFVGWTGRRLRRAYASPAPNTVGPAVGACVLALIVLDAALAAAVGIGWAVLAFAFLVPAAGLAQIFDVS